MYVTEPTLSDIHDMERVIELTFHFKIKTGIFVNKWDINKDISKLIKEKTDKMGLKILGKISYDPNVTKAQIAKKSIIEYSKNGISKELIDLWKNIEIEIKDDITSEK